MEHPQGERIMTQESKAGHSSCGSKTGGGCASASGAHGKTPESEEDDRRLAQSLARIRHKVLVLSGKGGVGKSTVAVNLAAALALSGKRVGLLDIDIHGPSIPTMLGLATDSLPMAEHALVPIELGGLKVMSIGFLLQDPEQAIIWRGPMKMGVIRQFLSDVDWGDLDYLVVDAPPGTGDEPLSICQLIGQADGAVIVTTPQEVALAAVRRSINFCRQLAMPVLGVVENMSGLTCPHCGKVTEVFNAGGGERMATKMNVPFLGRIPLDPAIGIAGDAGRPDLGTFAKTLAAQEFAKIIQPILELSRHDQEPAGLPSENNSTPQPKEKNIMRIAIPIANGNLALHFGHCEQFVLLDVDEKTKQTTGQQLLTPPPHEPGVLPRWLGEQGATVIIAGGMGQRAQDLFAENGIKVVIGAPAETPEKLVAAYLDGTLVSGDNLCDH
jgi:Mrp family chromosome partitioning ATPase/predicted Fe-Mo cluster-binding NifX family protein